MSASPLGGIEVGVEEGDVLDFETDVLVLKYAQGFHGADMAVADRLHAAGIARADLAPRMGDAALVEVPGGVAASRVLFLGVEPLYQFRYRQIRDFASRALRLLGSKLPTCRHLALTIHGPGYGLDEVEAFEAEVAGVIDAVTGGESPRELRRVSIVERDSRRVSRLRNVLPRLLPRGFIARGNLGEYLESLAPSGSEQFRSVGHDSDEKPTAFVAMPFHDDWLDHWELGIQPAAHEADFLCERADTGAFTGDILDWVKSRIRGSALVVAELSSGNPNVFLEVGYAWGCGVPTVLLAQEPEKVPFDVRGQRCVQYGRIGELKKRLARELKDLRTTFASRARTS